jgi:hypothetical protein
VRQPRAPHFAGKYALVWIPLVALIAFVTIAGAIIRLDLT